MLLALLVLALLTTKAVEDRPDGRIHVTTFESGGTLIETARGRFVLIGGGDSPTSLANSLGRKLPLFDRQIDWLIVPDGEVSGLAGIPDGLKVGTLLLNSEQPGRALASLLQALQTRGASLVRVEHGMVLDLGDGARLNLIDDEQDNLTVLLTADNARIAIVPRTRASQLPQLASVTAIILASGSSASWLEELDPVVAVIHGPKPLPLSTSLLATEERGWIELITDGEHLWVLTQHTAP
jgi:competence protein ComEC